MRSKLTAPTAVFVARILLLAAAYFATGRLGLALPYVGRDVTLIWPPTGIAVAALLAWGGRCWPGVLLGAWLVNVSVGSSPALSLAIAVGNTLAPVSAMLLLRRARFELGFRHPRDVLWFTLAGGFGAMSISALLGSLCLYLGAKIELGGLCPTALAWWLGDVMGVLVVAPPLMAFPAAASRRSRWWYELALLSVVALAAGFLGFGDLVLRFALSPPLAFLSFPVLIWAALRLGSWGASWTVLLLSAAAVWQTARGHGPFSQMSFHDGLALLWMYIAVAATISLLLSALQAERDQARAERDRLFDLSADLMCVLESGGRFRQLNPAFTNVLGYAPEELLPRCFTDLLHPAERSSARVELERLAQCGGVSRFKSRSQCRDGAWRWLDWTVSHSELGQNLLYAVGRDVTSAQAAEAALRESEGRFRTLIEDLDVGVLLQDSEDRILVCNAAACSMLGLKEEQSQGLTSRDPRWQLIREDGAAYPCDEAPSVLAARTKLPVHDVILGSLNLATGVRTWLQVSATPRLHGDGSLLHVLVSIVDITERKRSEEERRRLEAKILQAQKLESLGILAGGLAHDFNNLLTAILGYADLARFSVASGSNSFDYLEEVVKGIKRAAELTQQMLAYSGKSRFVLQPVVLSSLIEDMRRLLEISISKLCSLRFDFMPDLPPCEADPTQLRQILMNLILNASEAMGDRPGVITVRTGSLLREPDSHALAFLGKPLAAGLYVYLEVEDAGCGMSEETRAKIFDPFFTTKLTGRGLGLASVLGIVRGHRGAIEVRSEPGKGTSFKVLFPASLRAAEAAA